MCSSFFNLGRPNDSIEGYDVDLQKLRGLAKRVKNLKIPTVPVKQRILADTTRVPVVVLTDIEPNGADLNSLNSKVPIKRTINVHNLDNAAKIATFGFAAFLMAAYLAF